MPGGGIKKHETPEQAAIREVEEEIGVRIEQLDYRLGVYSNTKEGKNDTIYCFVVELSQEPKYTKGIFNFEISDIILASLEALPDRTSLATKTRVFEYKNNDISENIRPWS